MMVAIFHLARSSGLPYKTFDYACYGWTGVQIFFVISGFILPYSLYKTGFEIRDFGVFILKRIIRVYPAYIAAILIGVVLTFITHRENIPTMALFSQLLFVNDILGSPYSSVVFWTLAIEIQFYLVVGLLYPFFIKSNTMAIILVFALSLAAFLMKANNGLIFEWFPFFGIGILAFNKMFTNLTGHVFWLAMANLIIIVVIAHGIPHAIAALFAVLFILYGAFKKETPVIKAFLFLGTISYSLYLIHWDLGRAAVRLSRYIPLINQVGFLQVTVGIMASVFFAWLLYISVEKGSARISVNIRYKKKG